VAPTPDMAMLVPSGTAVLTDISATIILNNQPTPVRVLAPLVGFSLGGAHDFSNMGALGGCQGDHYDANKKPANDLDSRVVSFTGYTGGKFLDTSTAPSTINCTLVGGFYACGYGPINNNMPGPIANQTPYPGGATPIDPSDMITISGTGGTG